MMHFGASRSEYAALRHRAAHVASRGLFCLAVIVMFFLSAAVLLAGCTSGVDSTSSEDSSDGSVAEQATTSSESEADESGMDFSYSSRDLDASYMLKTRRISACRTIPSKCRAWALRLLTAR